MCDFLGYNTCKCAECGEDFECSTITKYKLNRNYGKIYFCSYKCYNAFLKREEEQWKTRHEEDFADIPEKTISLYTAYRYARRKQRADLELGL